MINSRSRFLSTLLYCNALLGGSIVVMSDVAPQPTVNGTKSKRPPVRVELIDVIH